MLVTRLYDWFFGPAAEGGQGRALSWSVVQPWPAWITLTLFALLGIWVFSSYLRERRDVSRVKKMSLASVRLVLLALALMMLYRLELIEFKTDLPDLLLLVDVSKSMQVDDAAPGENDRKKWKERIAKAGFSKPTRLDAARTFLLEEDARRLRWLSQHYRLKLYTIGDTVTQLPGEVEPAVKALRLLGSDEDASRLGDSACATLEQSRGRTTAAMIAFSDGITTDGITLAEAAAMARRRGVPMLTVGLGDQRPPRDTRLSDLSMDSVVFVGDTLPIEARLSVSGFLPEEKIRIVVRRADSTEILAQREVEPPDPGTTEPVFLAVTPKEKGRFEYIVEAIPAEGESQVENNRLARVVQVRDDTVRVLLIDSRPSFEFRYLKELLSRRLKEGESSAADRQEFQLATVLLDADPEYTQTDRTALAGPPVTREDLFQYDVVLFGDVNPQRIEEVFLKNLFDFVNEKGGGVVFIAGRQFTPRAFASSPIAPLFPIDPATVTPPPGNVVLSKPWSVRRAYLGRNDPLVRLGDYPEQTKLLWEQTPGLYWIASSLDVRPGARVLAEALPEVPGEDGDTGVPLATDLLSGDDSVSENTVSPKPVIISQYVGAGRVVFHATDETWLWSQPRVNRFFERYWARLVRSLCRSGVAAGDRDIEIAADRESYTSGEKVRLRVRFFDPGKAPAADDGVALTLESDRGERRRTVLHRGTTRGVFQATVDDLPTGVYRVVLAEPTLDISPPSTDFLISDAHGELSVTRMNVADLRRAAEVSGGYFYTIDKLDDLMQGIPATAPVPIEELDPIPVWNSHLVIILFLSLLVLEWILRRKAGMM